jgi:hypothetical protein
VPGPSSSSQDARSETALGVPRFYYSNQLPVEAVAIASIRTKEVKPSDLTSVQAFDLTGTAQGPGPYTIAGVTDDSLKTASGLLEAVAFGGILLYTVRNQFFEITNVLDGAGVPQFYQHQFQIQNADNITVLDQTGRPAAAYFFNLGNRTLYHNLNDQIYWVSYFSNGYYHRELLRHLPIIIHSLSALPLPGEYVFLANGGITMPDNNFYWIRWYRDNGYSVLNPYNVPLNDPWYPRVRFNLNPVPQVWASQIFQPYAPYILASWVRSTVLGPHLIQCERPQVYFDGSTYPDVLVYDQNYKIKYALDGTAPGTKVDKGYLFQWMKAQFICMDEANAVINVAVTLDPTDICFAFYAYVEDDYIMPVNVNPFTNPDVKDRLVEFYYSNRITEGDPFHNLFWRILASNGTTALDAQGNALTNDVNPDGIAPEIIFGRLASGYAVSPGDFTFTDARQRGGGLDTPYQTIEAARNFWDLGYWDGKPYPLGGAAAVYLPDTILNTLTRQQVADIVQARMAMGAMALIRYYDVTTGEETI